MRAQKSGKIFFISSMSAWVGGASSSCYSASKAALSLYVESLRSELQPFGIGVGSLEPGALRTHFLGPANAKTTIHLMAEYEGTVSRTVLQKTRDFNFKQRGDVKKAAKVIFDIITATGTAEGKAAPPRLVIGADAYEFAKNWCNTWLKTLEDWREVIVQTDLEE
jgi:NAD(P)-dependent dehydrogenase (short-subunit alcohol dehydrogenase family)